MSNVISSDYYEVEFPSPATKTVANGGGKKVRVYETKHDVSFPEMNEAWRQQDTAFMNTVARYCIQDTLLPQMILDKLSVLPNLIEMAKVTWVPIEYLITRY